MFLDHVSSPIIALAPMSGVTDLPFRRAVRRFGGASFVVSEMIASQSMIRHVKKSMLRGTLEGDGAEVVQIAGNEPDVMAQAALLAVDMGAKAIDLNLGCPAKKIAVNSYAGAALMRDAPLAQRIFEAVVKAVQIPVSVKMRMGWDHDNLNALSIGRIAQQSGISWITLHGRTRCQLYQGQANWDFIQSIAGQMDLPVIGNGDIVCRKQAKDYCTNTGVAGVMVGRACYGRPWFLSQISQYIHQGHWQPDPSLEMQKQTIHQHLEDILETYGTEGGIKIARKHLGWYSKGLKGASLFREMVMQEEDPKAVFRHIETFFEHQSSLTDSQDITEPLEPFLCLT